MWIFNTVLLITISSLTVAVQGETVYIGKVVFQADRTINVEETDYIFILDDARFGDGVWTSLSAYFVMDDDNATFQVWRPVQNIEDTFQLIGEKVIPAEAGDTQHVVFPEGQCVPVKEGDRLGIKSRGVGWGFVGGVSQNYNHKSFPVIDSNMAIGSQMKFDGSLYSYMKYAVDATYDTDSSMCGRAVSMRTPSPIVATQTTPATTTSAEITGRTSSPIVATQSTPATTTSAEITALDECAAGTDSCDVNAYCQDTADSYTCTCNDDYTGDGFSCVRIDGGGETSQGTIVNIGGTYYNRISGQYLLGRNVETVLDVDLESCAKLCRKSIGYYGFVCRSMDYVRSENKCILSDFSRLTGGVLVGDANIDYYEKYFGIDSGATDVPHISCEVVDMVTGRAVSGVIVNLYRLQRIGGSRDIGWTFVAQSSTNIQGLTSAFFVTDSDFEADSYLFRVEAGRYYGYQPLQATFKNIDVYFDVSDAMQMYQIRIMMSPYGYSTTSLIK